MEQNKKNNRFKLLCMGVVAFSAVACIVFSALGGGEGVQSEPETAVGFNSELPNANVESVSDSRVEAVRKEDERRKREELLGINGSTFNLLEVEEKEKKEKELDVDSLTVEMQNQTRAELEKQLGLQGSQSVAVQNMPDTVKRDYNAGKRRRKDNGYKDLQEIYGKELFPDKDDEKKTAKVENEKPKEEVKQEPAKNKASFNDMNKKSSIAGGNSVRAVVHGTHKDLTTNSTVKLRIIDPLVVDGYTIPRNSFIYGKVSFSDSRVQIKVDNINYQNNVIPFKGDIYDTDGSKGLKVGDNIVNDAAKETEAGVVSDAPTITRASGGTLSGFVVDGTNRAVNAVKNAVTRGTSKNKVTISENYMVLINTRK